MDNQTHYSSHISSPFSYNLQGVWNYLLDMGNLIQLQLDTVLKAVINFDFTAEDYVGGLEQDIDKMEVLIDKECTKILALHEPRAFDLRLVLATSKAVSDFERIGDRSNKIYSYGMNLLERGGIPDDYVNIKHIGEYVYNMLQEVLLSCKSLDINIALNVVKKDHELDSLYKAAMRILASRMMEDPRTITSTLEVIWMLRALEHMGEHLRDIAGHVIYIVRGKDIRHMSLKKVLYSVNK